MSRLKEIAGVFFKLGCIAFGGPAAHIAMMQEEIIEKRKWMDGQHFLDLIGATQLIPGPNSTEMTMHCGHERGGPLGLFVAGACFIFPAVVLTGLLAYLFVEYGQIPAVAPWVSGIKAAVLAIILAAIFKLGKKAFKNWQLIVLSVIIATLALIGYSEVYVLLIGGIAGGTIFWMLHKLRRDITPSVFIPGLALMGVSWSGAFKIFIIFLKVGSILYGSGYVLFAYLESELVANDLLTRTELVEAIAIGQFTPGPVLSTATFIGYQMGGWSGALAATLGIFLPSFLFVWLLNPLVPKMRQSVFMGYLLDAVNAAAVAIMAAVLLKMSADIIIDWRSAVITLLGLLAVFGPKKLSSPLIILIGAVLGFIFSYW